MDNSQTDINYWDCECDKNYIHKKSAGMYCKGCGSYSDEGSDSLVTEIESQYTDANELKLLKEFPQEGVYHGE